ncbi:hypothetical protein GOV12_01005 [Candidatus Pacearchaeota archaeon]|nr:hypothetical protein [Candidatus Pacearchaeota archaeon]
MSQDLQTRVESVQGTKKKPNRFRKTLEYAAIGIATVVIGGLSTIGALTLSDRSQQHKRAELKQPWIFIMDGKYRDGPVKIPQEAEEQFIENMDELLESYSFAIDNLNANPTVHNARNVYRVGQLTQSYLQTGVWILSAEDRNRLYSQFSSHTNQGLESFKKVPICNFEEDNNLQFYTGSLKYKQKWADCYVRGDIRGAYDAIDERINDITSGKSKEIGRIVFTSED